MVISSIKQKTVDLNDQFRIQSYKFSRFCVFQQTQSTFQLYNLQEHDTH